MNEIEEAIEAYQERTAENANKIAAFKVKQCMPYDFKVRYAKIRIDEFIRECDRRELNTHVSVGGLDSITLFLFIKSLGYTDIPGVSVSALEDRSIIIIDLPLRKAIRRMPYGFFITVRTAAADCQW